MAVIQEARANPSDFAGISGVPTRRVDDLVQAMGLTGISKSTVSKLCKDIDDRVVPSSTARSTATGPTSGWMRPT